MTVMMWTTLSARPLSSAAYSAMVHLTPPESSSLPPQSTPPRQADAERHAAAARQPAGEPYVFDLDGGRPCLDFVNTLGSSPSSTDHLARYADLVAFAAQSHLVTPTDAEWLQAQAELEPAV